MGTSATIAVGTRDQWEGVYVHYDGDPDHMVPALQKTYAQLDGDFDRTVFHTTRPDTPGYWSFYADPTYPHSADWYSKEDVRSNQDNEPTDYTYILTPERILVKRGSTFVGYRDWRE